jgi:phenylacetate-CoA ligase
MLFINGVKVFPSQIESVLLAVEGALPDYRIVLDRDAGGADTMEIQVSVAVGSAAFDEIRALEQLRQRLVRQLAAELELTAKISFVEPKTLKQCVTGKVDRVRDNRGQ